MLACSADALDPLVKCTAFNILLVQMYTLMNLKDTAAEFPLHIALTCTHHVTVKVNMGKMICIVFHCAVVKNLQDCHGMHYISLCCEHVMVGLYVHAMGTRCDILAVILHTHISKKLGLSGHNFTLTMLL